MASANELRSDSFLSQVERVRREISTKIQRSQQVLVEREATLLSELDELVVRYRGEGISQQIEELNCLKELQLSSVKENENKETVKKSVSVFEARVIEIRTKFKRDLASMRRVVLKWDECVFDKLSDIGSIQVSRCKDVKLTSDEVVVLTSGDSCVRYYNYSHQLIRQIIPRGEGNLVMNPCYFCVDKDNNILITDSATNCVLIFSSRGKLIHKFGQKGEDKGEFIDVTGIALDSEDRIIVVSWNPIYCIQIF